MRDTILVIFVILISLGIIFSLFETRYEKVREYYPHLKRWEFFIYGHHLMIPQQKKYDPLE